ncbi:MAG: 1-deoxy-D-xylulose-5-phosphate synthase, partial [Verrucomicrobiales bacterium]|nr:1-deoxy-D-xylulose-5-phosphate synthase [Verrucomicrobiales bacterium]
KPMDGSAIMAMASKVKVICTFEDHVLHNGFGAAVIELLHESEINTPVVRIGWPDEFVEHGNIPALREKHGLSHEDAISLINEKLGSLPNQSQQVTEEASSKEYA